MPESTLQDIITELTDAETKLKATIDKLFGKVETTDFTDEYKELQDVLKKLQSWVPPPEASTVG